LISGLNLLPVYGKGGTNRCGGRHGGHAAKINLRGGKLKKSTSIESVRARQVFSDRGHPGVETTVTTANGATGSAIVTAGESVGMYEVQFVYDGGSRWKGMGVEKAANNVNDIIAPAIIGKDSLKQGEIDNIMIELDGTKNKTKLGGNATASVSAAVLKAGAASQDIPLYQHIGGVNANVLATPGVLSFGGSKRYVSHTHSGGKPSYELVAHGFDTFKESAEACWHVKTALLEEVKKRYGISGSVFPGVRVEAGVVKSDRELWDLSLEIIETTGYAGKFGLQVDVAASTYYDREKDVYVGLFSKEEKTKEEMITLYHDMVKNYNFIIIEDPLHEDDFEGHAQLTKELGIQIVGDDLFTTNVERLKKGIEVGACNTVLLKVNQVGTISEALDTIQWAYKNGYAVEPCSSRGEGPEIADYSVGINAGTVRNRALGPVGNRFMQIEAELGTRAKYLGIEGLVCGPVGARK
jgi:enolase